MVLIIGVKCLLEPFFMVVNDWMGRVGVKI